MHEGAEDRNFQRHFHAARRRAAHRGLDIPPRIGVGEASGVSRATASGRLGGQAWALLTGQPGAATTTVTPSLDRWLTEGTPGACGG